MSRSTTTHSGDYSLVDPIKVIRAYIPCATRYGIHYAFNNLPDWANPPNDAHFTVWNYYFSLLNECQFFFTIAPEDRSKYARPLRPSNPRDPLVEEGLRVIEENWDEEMRKFRETDATPPVRPVYVVRVRQIIGDTPDAETILQFRMKRFG
jgi:hypothetical protein